MPISVVFDPPLPSDSPSTFNTKAFTLLGDLNDWSTQANALPGEVATNLTTLLASPPAIGSTTPAAGSFTTLTASTGASSTVSNPFDTPNVILKTVNSTVGNYSAIQNYNYSGTANSAILFVNDSQSAYPNNGGSIAFATYAGGGAGGTVKMTIAASGAVTIPGSLSLTGGTFGYGTGAGGTVTQATSKSTAVTLNKPCGTITTNNAALAAGATVSFTLTNSLLTTSSVVVLTPLWTVNANYRVEAAAIANGSMNIRVTNVSAGSLSEALAINFTIITGATS